MQYRLLMRHPQLLPRHLLLRGIWANFDCVDFCLGCILHLSALYVHSAALLLLLFRSSSQACHHSSPKKQKVPKLPLADFPWAVSFEALFGGRQVSRDTHGWKTDDPVHRGADDLHPINHERLCYRQEVLSIATMAGVNQRHFATWNPRYGRPNLCVW